MLLDLTYSGDAGGEGGLAVIDMTNGPNVHVGFSALVGAQKSTNCGAANEIGCQDKTGAGCMQQVD
jgi:hypothetical protein